MLNKSDVAISVCVTAYQHEKYIERCVRSIVGQECDFKFEVLLGEDDSSDKTREICKKLAKEFPEIIRLFLNDRSNVIKINGSATGRANFINNINKAKGRYLAFCDGDDYWESKGKLQKQFSMMVKTSIPISFHYAHSITNNNLPVVLPANRNFRNGEIISASEVIESGGSLMPMATIMVKRKTLVDNIDGLKLAPGGHYFVQVVCSAEKGAVFVDGVYSYYRRDSESSLMKNVINKKSKRHEWFSTSVKSAWLLDEKLNYMYHASFNRAVYLKAKSTFRKGFNNWSAFWASYSLVSDGFSIRQNIVLISMYGISLIRALIRR